MKQFKTRLGPIFSAYPPPLPHPPLQQLTDTNLPFYHTCDAYIVKMSGMVGGARTALEVGRLLLSVDPLGDPMGCLLALDSHALASREGNFLLELYRLKLLIGYSPAELTKASSAATRDGENWKWFGSEGIKLCVVPVLEHFRNGIDWVVVYHR